MPVTETPLQSAVFDQLQLAMAANPVAFAELYRDYLADAWQCLQMLQGSVQQVKVETVRAKAHYLRSSSLVVGAHLVARHAAMLEDAAMASETRDFSGLLDDLARTLKAVQDELAGRLGRDVIPADEPAA